MPTNILTQSAPEDIPLPASPCSTLSFDISLDDIRSPDPADASLMTNASSETLVNFTSPTTLHPSDFSFLRVIGEGASGDVYQVRDKSAGKHFALKVATKNDEKLNVGRRMMEELRTMRRLNGSVWVVGVEGAWNDTRNWYFLMPFVPGGDLLSEIEMTEGGKFPLTKSKTIFAEMVCALTYIHRRGIIHCDVKPENILRTIDGHYQLADLGFAKLFDRVPSEVERTHQPYFPWLLDDVEGVSLADCKVPSRDLSELPFVTDERRGTDDYMAPEILQGLPYSFPVDFWSLAIVLYGMTTGRMPWAEDDDDEYDLCTKIITYDLVFEPNDFVCDTGKEFMEEMLKKQPEERLPILDIPRHPFLRDLPWDTIEDRTYGGDIFISTSKGKTGTQEQGADFELDEIPFSVGERVGEEVDEEFEYCSKGLELARSGIPRENKSLIS